MHRSKSVAVALVFAASAASGAEPQPQRAVIEPSQVPVLTLASEVVECETLLPKAVVSAGPASVQPMQGFGNKWGEGAQVFWRPPAPVDTPIRNWPHLRLYPKIAKAGKYRVTLAYTVAPDYGTVRVFLAGKPVKDLNGYAPGVDLRRVDLGEHQLKPGTVEFVFTVFAKDPQSSNYFVGLDRFEFRSAP